jgi:drug/metabolite transporter (DMT)-like permease
MAVLNATAPIWGALVARLWLGQRMAAARWAGLVIGLAGVVGLVWGKADLQPGSHGISPALGFVPAWLRPCCMAWRPTTRASG